MTTTPIDPSSLDAIVREFAPQSRAGLLPALHEAQRKYGYLSESVVASVANGLGVPLADAYGIIDFYSLFYREPVGKTIIRVCTDPACAMQGGEGILQAACQNSSVAEGEVSVDGSITVERSPCLGLCNVPPAIQIVSDEGHTRSIGHANASTLEAITNYPLPTPDYIGGDVRILTALCGKGRATMLAEYEAAGGMAAFKTIVDNRRSPASVIDEIKRAGLVGCGGAAFPTGAKWEGAAREPATPKYFVVNGDESEPGTFKDRIVMEGDPCRVLEGAMLGAYAIGANKIYFYIRGEYPEAIACVEDAVGEMRRAGYVGTNVRDSDFDLDVEVRSGAGAYVCGEETALFESIEGKRGFPRIKPPFPTQHGLFGQPTVINNVETLAKVPFILAHGADEFRQMGTEKSPGMKLFCLSGDVARPGLYEVPFGVTLRHMLFDLAGGVTGELQAILFGGAAGAFATEQHLDVRLTFEDLRAAGLPLGSGVIMVMNETRDIRDVLMRLARFFAHESCGKCYPCQLGTQRQYEILKRIAEGRGLDGDATRLRDVGWTMTDASLCGLGQTAASAVLSAMKLWGTSKESPLVT